MPDDRLIHLTLGHSEKINQLTDFERLVWLMYKLAADDFGVMRLSAAPLQEAAYWLERKPAKLVQRAIERVSVVRLVQTFDHQGRTFCYQPDWQTWQKILYPRGTKQPAPPFDSLDLNTQWLFQHHPDGAKLSAWQHPDLREKSRKIPGKIPDSPPELSSPVFVKVSSEGVRDREGAGVKPPVRPSAVSSIHRGGHQRHSWCSERICVPDFTHDRLSRQLGRPDASAWLLDWYPTVLASVADAPIGEKPEDFWPRIFAAAFPPVAAPARDKTAENRARDERLLAEIQEERRLRAGR